MGDTALVAVLGARERRTLEGGRRPEGVHGICSSVRKGTFEAKRKDCLNKDNDKYKVAERRNAYGIVIPDMNLGSRGSG